MPSYTNKDVRAAGALAGAGRKSIRWLYVANRAASEIVIKFYDAAAVEDVVIEDGAKYNFPLFAGGVFCPPIMGQGLKFSQGIVVRACTGIADDDDTDVGANECVVNFEF